MSPANSETSLNTSIHKKQLDNRKYTVKGDDWKSSKENTFNRHFSFKCLKK